MLINGKVQFQNKFAPYLSIRYTKVVVYMIASSLVNHDSKFPS